MEDARYSGLTQKEVEERTNAGKTNRSDASTGLTVKQIILSNTLTYFNLIFLVVTVLLCIVGSFRNLTFLPIILWNIIIGIIQEWRAKRTLDKMNLLNAPHAVVLRDGKESKVASEELVQDDVVLLSAGEQICADATVLDGSIQVNESLLTGESDEIDKKKGDTLLSGSFVVSGRCHARLDKVGNESYISKLTSEAKTIDGYEQSEMVRSINEIIKWAGIIIIPIGAILFYQSFFLNGVTFQKSITSMVAAVLGMIPEGLYLLTTVALALSTMRLSKRKVLLHDMKSIETLARVDVLCVDKTGTITEPEMKVREVVFEGEDVTERLTDYVLASRDNNATMQALQSFIPENAGQRHAALKVVPFTSARKYGGIVFDDATYLLGAPEFIMRSEFEGIEDRILPYTDKGYRVLLFAKYDGADLEDGLSGSIEPLAYVIFENPIRENARQTFEYFKKQKVAIKVISGDNPKTVSEIAGQAGIDGARNYVDASTLKTESQVEEALETKTVFGRVTPKQKQDFVSALQKNGHTVAMTGDGVNDILAMKDADCSVAMASGSEATAQVAQVVLLDSDFVHMPDVVLEGRQVVNNIQRSASLFLVKNIFSLLMAVFSAVLMFTYPLEPSQISLVTGFTIGVPGFLLALEPTKDRIKGHFLTNVFIKAFPAGLTDMVSVAALVVCGKVFGISDDEISTMATLLLGAIGLIVLVRISRPFNRRKWAILWLNVFGLVFCFVFLKYLFAISPLSGADFLLVVVFMFAADSILRHLTHATERIAGKIRRKRQDSPRHFSRKG
ncbi:cation-translocating P-type ATPase [Ligilactobacillus sp.]|uniref:cation-translocating P-type ATPase n=1 Tax=Ligilactobacillus sp. TaxID=2767921 RepID=UPI002FE2BFF2